MGGCLGSNPEPAEEVAPVSDVLWFALQLKKEVGVGMMPFDYLGFRFGNLGWILPRKYFA